MNGVGIELLKRRKNAWGIYEVLIGDLNNSNNSLMQINILKRFNLAKLEKRNKLLFRKLQIILDGNNINMIN